jgi:hypothetical protein
MREARTHMKALPWHRVVLAGRAAEPALRSPRNIVRQLAELAFPAAFLEQTNER